MQRSTYVSTFLFSLYSAVLLFSTVVFTTIRPFSKTASIITETAFILISLIFGTLSV